MASDFLIQIAARGRIVTASAARAAKCPAIAKWPVIGKDNIIHYQTLAARDRGAKSAIPIATFISFQ
jgi:hypothetical protein